MAMNITYFTLFPLSRVHIYSILPTSLSLPLPHFSSLLVCILLPLPPSFPPSFPLLVRMTTLVPATHPVGMGTYQDWLVAWKEWARTRKRGKMAQFIVDKLEDSVSSSTERSDVMTEYKCTMYMCLTLR